MNFLSFLLRDLTAKPLDSMLLNNKTLDSIIAGDISVVFRVWKRPTVKTGGTLKTRKGVLFIEKVEQIDRSRVSGEDIRNAGLARMLHE